MAESICDFGLKIAYFKNKMSKMKVFIVWHGVCIA